MGCFDAIGVRINGANVHQVSPSGRQGCLEPLSQWFFGIRVPRPEVLQFPATDHPHA